MPSGVEEEELGGRPFPTEAAEKGEISPDDFLARMSNTVNAVTLVLRMIRETLKQEKQDSGNEV